MQRAGRKVFLRVWHCHPAGFGGVLELVMAAACGDLFPAIGLEHSNHVGTVLMCSIHTTMKAASLPFIVRPVLAGNAPKFPPCTPVGAPTKPTFLNLSVLSVRFLVHVGQKWLLSASRWRRSSGS